MLKNEMKEWISYAFKSRGLTNLFPLWSPHPACHRHPASQRDLVCGVPIPSPRLGFPHILEKSDPPSTVYLWLRKEWGGGGEGVAGF